MPAAARKTASTYTLACKLPQGLTIPLPGGRTIKLHGSASPFAIANHGMTQGIAEDDWTAIQTIYAGKLWLVNEAVFAMPRAEDASAKAIELKDADRGFEPIDPRNPALHGGRIESDMGA